MDRITPFKADEVLFAHRVASVDREQRRLTVELDVVPRIAAEPLFEIANQLGLEPQRLELAGPEESSRGLDLMPRDGDGGGRASRLNRLLLLLFVALAAVAVVLPLERQQRTADELAEDVRGARVEAEESMRLRDELQALERSSGFVASTKTGAPMTASVLAELTRVIPDQAYVTQLRLEGRELQIHGLADSASELIGRLAASPMFDGPQFRSPVTRDPRAAKERFHIQVGIAEAAS
ncbi:MAG: PilN domain-containing protein [Geminicoccaceae bacterium]|nr:PilN domain-containing protein [Geminicoccaceae bacterium]